MAGDYTVTHGGKPIGRIMRFAGAKPAKRWAAYSIHRDDSRAEASEAFPTRRAAADWLVQRHLSRGA